MYLIASYPRSGNHLCRFIVEFITGKATQGCLGNSKDGPICKNTFAECPHVLAHVDDSRIIAQKAHSWSEIKSYSNEYAMNFAGMVHVGRNPIASVIGHTLTEPASDDWAEFLCGIQTQYDKWEGLLLKSLKTSIATQYVWYDDRVSGHWSDSIKSIKSISIAFWSEIQPDRLFELMADFDRVRSFSAIGKGRSWAGTRSLGAGEDFHLRTITADWQDALADFMVDRLAGTVESIKRTSNANEEYQSCKYRSCGELVQRLEQWSYQIQNMKGIDRPASSVKHPRGLNQ